MSMMYGDSDHRKWNFLVDLAVLLSEGKVDLEDLVTSTHKIVDEDEDSTLLSVTPCVKKPRTVRHHGKKMNWGFTTAMIMVPTGCQETKIMVPTALEDIKKSHHQGFQIKNLHTMASFEIKKSHHQGFEIKNLHTMAAVGDAKKSNLRFKIQTIRKPDKKPSYAVMSKDQESSRKRKRDEETMQWIVSCGGDAKSAVLVMEKDLFASDVNPVLARLSLPQKQAKKLSLTREEMFEADCREGLAVAVIEPDGTFGECGMRIRNWKCSSQYALNGGWNAFCDRNKLKQGTTIKVWSFQNNHKRCLAIVRA